MFNRLARTVIWTDAFAAGAVLMSLEILAFRVIGKTFGSALRETSTVIAVFLVAMSIGYFIGGRLGDRYPAPLTLAIVLFISSLTTMCVPLLDHRISDAVYRSTLPTSTHAGIVALLLFFVPTVLLASVSPIAVRLFADPARTGSVAGAVAAWSTAGSIIGSLGTAFYLIDAFRSVDRSIVALAIVAIVLAAATVSLSSERRFSVAATIVCMIAALSFVRLAWLSSVEEKTAGGPDFGHRVVFRADSPFHRIVVRDFNRTRQLYFDRNLQSMMKLDDEFGGGTMYTRYFHFAAVLRPEMREALFIGLGGGTGPKEFVHDYPRVVATGVDIDPLVVEVAQKFFKLRPSPRLQLVISDGRMFVKRTKKKFDIVIVDTYTTNRYGSTIPAHLTTTQFFSEVKSVLAPGGVVVFNCAARPDRLLTRSISKTLYSQFEYQLIFDDGANSILFASASDIKEEATNLESKVADLRSRGVIRHPLLEEFARNRVTIPISRYLGAPVLTDDYAPVDTLVLRANSGR